MINEIHGNLGTDRKYNPVVDERPVRDPDVFGRNSPQPYTP